MHPQPAARLGWLLVGLAACAGQASSGEACGPTVSLAVIVEPDPILLDDRPPSSALINPVQRWRTQQREEQVDPEAWGLLAPLTRKLRRTPVGFPLRDALLTRLRAEPCTVSDVQVFQASTGESPREIAALKRRMLIDRVAQDLLIVRSLLRLESDAGRVVGYLKVFFSRRGHARSNLEFDLQFHSQAVGIGVEPPARIAAWAADDARLVRMLQATMADEVVALLASGAEPTASRVRDPGSGAEGDVVLVADGRVVARLGGVLVSRPQDEWRSLE